MIDRGAPTGKANLQGAEQLYAAMFQTDARANGDVWAKLASSLDI
jgi:hypothetical protein